MLHLVLYSITLLSLSRFARIFSLTGSIFADFGTWSLCSHVTACLLSSLSSSTFQDRSQWCRSGEFHACVSVFGVSVWTALAVLVESRSGV